MLNEQQQEVVRSPLNQNMLIIAGAGAGKTSTLLSRIRRMICEENIDPRTILLSTFTVEATHNMSEKLKKICGNSAQDIFIGTLDSLALRILMKYAQDMVGNGRNKIFDVSEYSPMFLKFLTEHSNRNLILDQVKYLIIDEYQDISDIQYQIFLKFYNNGSILTAVGDDAQNIYSFRGSDVSYILNFEKSFTPCNVFLLLTNYRSTEQIVRFANYSIKQNKKQLNKAMIAHNKGGFKPKVLYCNDFVHMKNQLILLVRSNSNLKEVAIISRYKKILYEIEILLNENGIPAKVLDGKVNNSDKSAKVTLCTIHKSKGLEWDDCILIGLHDDIFPKSKQEKELEEERRLFYVACTRAKKKLFMLFNKTNYSATNEFAVSRFISEIPTSLYNHNLQDIHKPDLESKSTFTFKQNLNVTSLIRLLTGNDYMTLRDNGILPHLYFRKKKLHNSTKHSKAILDANLESNFGLMVDLMLYRMILSKLGIIPFAKKARQLLSMISLDYIDLDIYNTYLSQNRHNSNEIISLLSDEVIASQIQPILLRLQESGVKYNIDTNLVPVGEPLPEIIKNMINKHIIEFENLENTWDTLIICCFWLAQSEDLLSGKRTIIFHQKLITRELFSYYNQMFRYMLEYADSYTNNLTEVHSIWRINNGIYGEIDALHEFVTEPVEVVTEPVAITEVMFDIPSKILIDWKVSTQNIQMSWIMQLLCYYYLGKMNKKKIKAIGIYNPLQGTLSYSKIGWWKGGEELAKYLIELSKK